jgi:hypothetical protein
MTRMVHILVGTRVSFGYADSASLAGLTEMVCRGPTPFSRLQAKVQQVHTVV